MIDKKNRERNRRERKSRVKSGRIPENSSAFSQTLLVCRVKSYGHINSLLHRHALPQIPRL
ncbi:hypothetical protein, partial [Mycobacterium tuberculosis]